MHYLLELHKPTEPHLIQLKLIDVIGVKLLGLCLTIQLNISSLNHWNHLTTNPHIPLLFLYSFKGFSK